jgi:hypothetical protein
MSTKPRPSFAARFLLDALASGQLPSVHARAVHARAVDDDAWRAYYHALRSVERACARTHGDELPPVSVGQRETLRALILDGAEASSREAQKPVAHASRVGVIGGALAVATLLVFVIVNPPKGDEASDDFQARGTGGAVGIRAVCVDPDTRVLRDEAEGGSGASAEGGRLACAAGDVLVAYATNLSAGEREVRLVVAAEDGARIVDDGTGASAFPVAKGAVRAALPQGVSLGAPGRRTLFVLFAPPTSSSKRSAHDRELQAALDELKREGIDARGLPWLPVSAFEVQARIDVDVTPADEKEPPRTP